MLTPNVRGGLVVAAGVIVGIVMLAHARPAHRAQPGAVTRPPRAVQQLPPVTTAPLTVPAHDPASVPVLVLNGVNVQKPIASSAAKTVVAAGYTNATPKDAATTIPASVVYFQPGYDADAVAVAAAVALPSTAAQPFPSPAPPAIGNAGDAPVTVIIGPDSPVAQNS